MSKNYYKTYIEDSISYLGIASCSKLVLLSLRKNKETSQLLHFQTPVTSEFENNKGALWFFIAGLDKHERYINNSLHLARKYATIFVRGHYLFREANSFPRA